MQTYPSNRATETATHWPPRRDRFHRVCLSAGHFSLDALAGTSANTNAVQLLDSYADQATIIAKTNELIAAQRR